MMKEQLIEKREWRGEYKGIPYEIVFWSDESMRSGEHGSIYSHKGIWNSYIVINKKAVPERFDELIPPIVDATITPTNPRQRYDYYKLEDIFNFAYGITYFEPLYDPISGDICAIKVGNDYNHIWNENQYLDKDVILEDVEKSIDSFIKNFPDYLVRSNWDGNYIKLEDREKYDNEKRKQSIPQPNKIKK